MGLNYDQPSTSAQVESSLSANPSISIATQAAITKTLGLGPGVTVVVGEVLPDGTIVAPTPPPSPEMLVLNVGTSGGTWTPSPTVQQAMNKAKVLVFNTDGGVKFIIPGSAGTVEASAQTVSDHNAQDHSAQTVAAPGADRVFDRVVQLGNGNDDVAILDGKATKIIGSAGNDKLVLAGGNDMATGGSGNDDMSLGGGRDIAVVGWGNDKVDGGVGWDTVVFTRAGTDNADPAGSGATTPGQPGVGDWAVNKVGDKLVITSTSAGGNSAELVDVNFIQFGEYTLANTQFSVVAVNNENDATIARLYQITFGRSPDEGGVEYWFGQSKAGASLQSITNQFLSSPESKLVVAQNNAEFVIETYNNAFGRAPEAAGFAYWLNQLDNGMNRSVMIDSFATSIEAKATIINVQVFTDWV